MREDRSSDPDNAAEGRGGGDELARLREGERSLLASLSLLLEEEKKGMQDDADNGMKRTRGRGDIVRVVSGGIERQKYGRGTERGERPPRRIAPEKRGDDGRGRRWYRPKGRRRGGGKRNTTLADQFDNAIVVRHPPRREAPFAASSHDPRQRTYIIL